MWSLHMLSLTEIRFFVSKLYLRAPSWRVCRISRNWCQRLDAMLISFFLNGQMSFLHIRASWTIKVSVYMMTYSTLDGLKNKWYDNRVMKYIEFEIPYAWIQCKFIVWFSHKINFILLFSSFVHSGIENCTYKWYISRAYCICRCGGCVNNVF